MEVQLPPYPLTLVFVKLPNGEKINLTVHPEDSILTVKGRIETQAGVPVEHQALVFLGKLLEDGLTLKDYQIHGATTIDVHQAEEQSESRWPHPTSTLPPCSV